MKRTCFLLISLLVTGIGLQIYAQSYFPQKNNPHIKVQDKISIRAYAFPLSSVRLTGASPFKHALQKNTEYLNTLDADRLLHRFRLYAGLTPKAALYEGWESLGVSGFTLGHFLSALAITYASTGDSQYKGKATYIINELLACQQARGDGYVGAIPEQDRIFDEVAAGKIRSQGFDLNGGWVPWYTVHKLLAGLLDVYLFTNNENALVIAEAMAKWADKKFKNLTEEQFQKMLNAEHGGMMETLTNLYSITGKKDYLVLAQRFYHQKILSPFEQGKDDLDGIHANTQVPKVLGSARLYEITGDPVLKKVAEFYWNNIVSNHSYIIGGASEHELFNKPNSISQHLGTTAAEVCHTYNMLKITRHLFQWEPVEKYAAYYERALYNHILASQDPDNGMFNYFTSMKPGHFKTYSTPFGSFWCCVGTGMENHSRYTESIYYYNNDGIFINLFIPSQVEWKEKNIVLEQITSFPETENTTFTIRTNKPQTFSLYLRYPQWATEGLSITVNNKLISIEEEPGSYITIKRLWKPGDVVRMQLPMKLYTETAKDSAVIQSVLYGPLVLAGELGKESMKAPGPYSDDLNEFVYQPVPENTVPDLITNKRPVSDWLRKDENSLAFSTMNVGTPKDVRLIPFYKLHHQRYTVYWNVFDKQSFELAKAGRQEAEEQKRVEELRTNDILRVGEMQPERDHNLQGENTTSGSHVGRQWRMANKNGWFSFEMKVNPGLPQELVATYWGSDDYGRRFDILLEGTPIAPENLTAKYPQKFYDVVYKIPLSLTKNKQKVIIRFQPHPENVAGGLYGCRIRNQ